MSILSFFRKPNAEVVIGRIVDNIIVASFLYRKEIAHSDNQQSADAGVEVAYLLLHVLDAELFARLGASRRDVLFDRIAKSVITSYANASLRPETPPHFLFESQKNMLDTLNSRQMTYGRCRSKTDGHLSSVGTVLFAFLFFVHRALGRTNRTDVDDILAGDIAKFKSNPNGFPGWEENMLGVIWFSSTLKALRMQRDVKYLR